MTVLKPKPLLRIRAERLRRGWTQVVLAYHAKVPLSELSRIENGMTQPYPSYAARLCAVLELTPEQLTEEV